MATKSFSGGDKLEARLKQIAENLAKAQTVRVGFLGDATEENGTNTAQVAYIQEYGATINVAAHETTIYRQTSKRGGGFNKNGRFVPKEQSNFATQHQVPAHTITIPARPFFRSMIAENKAGWGPTLAKELKSSGYDAAESLKAIGEVMIGQLQSSIQNFTDPPNAPSTLARKMFASPSPLIDTNTMVDSVAKEVT